MNSKTHAFIAENIVTGINSYHPVNINERWFKITNMIPDATWYKLAHPRHYANMSLGFIVNRIKKLCEYQLKDTHYLDWRFNYRLGLIMHYISDYFCKMHRPGEAESYWAHFKYENAIGRQVKNNLTAYEDLYPIKDFKPAGSLQEIVAQLMTAQKEYYQEGTSCIKDIAFALRYAAEVAISIVGICLKNAEALYWDKSIAHGYV